jgi:hypothetical protein
MGGTGPIAVHHGKAMRATRGDRLPQAAARMARRHQSGAMMIEDDDRYRRTMPVIRRVVIDEG